MKPIFLIAILLLAINTSQAGMQHGGHNGAEQSLLPECHNPATLPSPHCGRAPSSRFDQQGILYVAFSQHGHIYLTTSSDQGKTFSAASVVNRTPELIYDDGENRPKIVLGKSSEVYVSWTHKTEGRYSGDVRFARSVDGGKTFYTPITINSDRALISHRFEAMTLDQQGRIVLIWIDKRDSEQAKKQQLNYAGASLYYTLSDDSGASFQPNKKLVDNSCECCRIALDNDSRGRVVALWRHVYPVNMRDHAIAYVPPENPPIQGPPIQATDDGWQIDGCPHHGPDISIDSKDRAHLAWFTQGEKNKGLMYGRFDFDDGKTGLLKSIDSSPSASRPQVQTIGRNVYLLWKRFNGTSMELLSRHSSDEGHSWSEPRTIATTDNGSDHPDWVSDQQQLFAAWHTQSEGLRLIPVAVIQP